MEFRSIEGEGESVIDITTVGIDLAKKMFSVHGMDAQGKVLLKKTVSRGKLLDCFAKPMNE